MHDIREINDEFDDWQGNKDFYLALMDIALSRHSEVFLAWLSPPPGMKTQKKIRFSTFQNM